MELRGAGGGDEPAHTRCPSIPPRVTTAPRSAGRSREQRFPPPLPGVSEQTPRLEHPPGPRVQPPTPRPQVKAMEAGGAPFPTPTAAFPQLGTFREQVLGSSATPVAVPVPTPARPCLPPPLTALRARRQLSQPRERNAKPAASRGEKKINKYQTPQQTTKATYSRPAAGAVLPVRRRK